MHNNTSLPHPDSLPWHLWIQAVWRLLAHYLQMVNHRQWSDS